MYSWLKRCASWFASAITLRARSVNRSNIVVLAVPHSEAGALDSLTPVAVPPLAGTVREPL
jgi:hypothetical protein